MGKKKIFECAECVQLFSGRTLYNYHMNAHKRTALPVPKVVAPKPAKVYHERTGEEPR